MRPTASSLWLAELCPASHVLPQIRETSGAQARGSAVHRFLERAPSVGRDAALAELDDDAMDLCSALDPSTIPTGSREVALAYNLSLRVGNEIGNGGGRVYPDQPGIACGTADLVAADERLVWDYKTGWPEPAADSLQLLALGLYAARTFGWTRVTVGHLRLVDGKLRPDPTEYGPVDLAAAHERIADIYRRYEADFGHGEVDVHPGSHCTDCSAQPQCPATTALVRQVAAGSDAALDLAPQKAWEFLLRAEDLTKRVRAELKRQAVAAPIQLANGKRLAIMEVEKSRISPAALPVLRQTVSQEKLDTCCSISKAALTKALGKGVAALVLRKLSDAGLMTETVEQHMREVSADKAEAA